jgi:hypothetical protein
MTLKRLRQKDAGSAGTQPPPQNDSFEPDFFLLPPSQQDKPTAQNFAKTIDRFITLGPQTSARKRKKRTLKPLRQKDAGSACTQPPPQNDSFEPDFFLLPLSQENKPPAEKGKLSILDLFKNTSNIDPQGRTVDLRYLVEEDAGAAKEEERIAGTSPALLFTPTEEETRAQESYFFDQREQDFRAFWTLDEQALGDLIQKIGEDPEC